MKKFVLLSVILLVAAASVTFAQRKRTAARTLTLAAAQRILNQQINEGTADNVLFTCRACYDPDDMQENDNFPLVTEFSPALIDFLVKKGYVRIGTDGTQYFTAKAKQSPYFEAFGDGSGRLGGAGFRFRNFRNPKITTSRITDLKNVLIQFESVPTDLTKEFFGNPVIIVSNASFTYEDGSWSVCLMCGEPTFMPSDESGILVPATSRKALAEKSWDEFWTKFTAAVHKKDFKTLIELSSSDETFFDGGGGGTSRDWFNMMLPEWDLVKKAVASGVEPINVSNWDGEERIDRSTKKHIPMIFTFEKDNKWRFFGVMGD